MHHLLVSTLVISLLVLLGVLVDIPTQIVFWATDSDSSSYNTIHSRTKRDTNTTTNASQLPAAPVIKLQIKLDLANTTASKGPTTGLAGRSAISVSSDSTAQGNLEQESDGSKVLVTGDVSGDGATNTPPSIVILISTANLTTDPKVVVSAPNLNQTTKPLTARPASKIITSIPFAAPIASNSKSKTTYKPHKYPPIIKSNKIHKVRKGQK